MNYKSNNKTDEQQKKNLKMFYTEFLYSKANCKLNFTIVSDTNGRLLNSPKNIVLLCGFKVAQNFCLQFTPCPEYEMPKSLLTSIWFLCTLSSI